MSSRFSKKHLVIFVALAAGLLTMLFPLPAAILTVGHPWKMELVTFLFISFAFVFGLYKRKSLIDLESFDAPVLFLGAFLVWSTLSLLWAGAPWSVFHHSAIWFCYSVLYVFFVNSIRNEGRVAMFTSFLTFFAIVLAGLTILAYTQVLANPEYEAKFRVTYSKYSEMLVLLTPFFFGIAVYANRKVALLHNFAALISFTAIVISLSRTSFIAVAAGLICVCVLLGILLRTRRTLLRAAGILTLFVLIFSGAQFLSTARGNESTLYGRFSSSKTYQTSSSDIRRLLLEVSFEMITDSPLLGVGADNFGLEINKYRARFAKANPDNETVRAGQEVMLERAHNEYAQVLSELGIVGSAIFAGFLVSGLILFLRRVRGSRRKIETAIRVGAASGVFAFLISSLASSFSFRALQNGVLFFAMFAILVVPYGSRYQEDKERRRYFLMIPALLFCLFSVGAFVFQAASGFIAARGNGLENDADAIETYKTAGALDSTNAAVDMAIAMRYFNQKEPALAAPYFRSVIAKGGGVIASYFYLATSYRLAGDLDAAANAAHECAAIYPRSPFSHLFLADLLKRSGKKSEAEREIRIALEINRREAQTWHSIFEKSALETSIETRSDDTLIQLADLSPNTVVQAVIGVEKLYQ